MDDGLFPPLGASASLCGVYWCTMTVDEHAVPPFDPETGEVDWDSTIHYNKEDRVGFLAPMPEEWR